MSVANFADMAVLSNDFTFGNRVLIAVTQYCWNTVSSEGSGVSNHALRKAFAAGILNSPQAYRQLFANVVASNSTVANEATSGGTLVGLSPSQVTTAALLCLDTDIANAVAAAFNAFIAGI